MAASRKRGEQGEGGRAPDAPPPEGHSPGILVVGIGGSAGGVWSLREFFANVPAQTGMTFVIVLHLSPEAESSLAEILQQVSALPVHQVRESVHTQPDRVYVVAPNQRLRMEDGWIRVDRMEDRQDRLVPIDRFFITLAQAYGRRAACVVLSGTGADGAEGLKQVKELGGLTVVQDPGEAEHAGMPRSALNTRMADLVLPVREMPARLLAYGQMEENVRLPALPEGADEAYPAPGPEAAAAEAIRELLALVRARTGHDYGQYKRPTVLRRLARRMQVTGFETVPEYLEYLRGQTAEIHALQRDLLISVTSFFRDPGAWRSLETHVIPRLFDGGVRADPARVWAAGCATGEEAYSLAMLLSEHVERLNLTRDIQVFATDLDQESIGFAREGLYEETIAAAMPPERLRRFFQQDGNRYRVRKELRERVLFACHNVIRDPPFSRVDLVVCRNLLIYLNRETQERVLGTFHFALRPDGCLFLGGSESADEPHNLFAPLDKKQRLFRRRAVPVAAAPIPAFAAGDAPFRPLPERQAPSEPGLFSLPELYRALLEQHAPPSVLVNARQEVIYSSERAGRFLRWAGGEPTRDLLRLVHPGLRLELQVALNSAAAQDSAQSRSFLLELEGKPRLIRVTVHPANRTEPESGCALITFDERDIEERELPAGPDEAGAPMARQLGEELQRVRSEMRSTLEQYATTSEELRASNEELQAMNEELRSASEELETGKEELQSLNEELTTVNQELKIKVDEVSRANSDLRNLMASTQIGTLFLDRAFRVVRYTPAARELFNLIPGDTGRPITDLAHRLEYDALLEDTRAVLERLVMVEREVRSREGSWYNVRILPYRSLEDRIEGVVLTFLDVTGRREAEVALHESQERFRVVVENAPDYAMYLLDLVGNIVFWSAGAERVFGFKAEEILGRPCAVTFTAEDGERGAPGHEMRQARTAGSASDRRWHVRKDGSLFWADGVLTPLYDRSGQVSGYAKVLRDATREKEIGDALQHANRSLEERVRERTAELERSNEALLGESEALRRSLEARQRLLRQLATAEEDERRRISRELHDQLGQTVTALILDLGRLRATRDLSEAARTEIQRICSVAEALGRGIHHVAVELRPSALDDLGLVKAVRNYLDDWSERHGIAVDFHVGGREEERLPSEVETAAYRIVQEALHNVLKHAGASIASVLLESDGDHLRLTIEDTGEGFDTERLASAPGRALGIVGMRERAALLGGELTVESSPGHGTTVFVRIPLPEEEGEPRAS